MAAGKRCSAGRLTEARPQHLGAECGDGSGREARGAQPRRSSAGRGEGPFEWDLLVEQHAEQKGERVLAQQPVGVGVAGDREGARPAGG